MKLFECQCKGGEGRGNKVRGNEQEFPPKCTFEAIKTSRRRFSSSKTGRGELEIRNSAFLTYVIFPPFNVATVCYSLFSCSAVSRSSPFSLFFCLLSFVFVFVFLLSIHEFCFSISCFFFPSESNVGNQKGRKTETKKRSKMGPVPGGEHRTDKAEE